MDDFDFEQAIDRLCKGIVVGIADTANRGLDARVCQPFGVFDGQVLGRFNRSSQHPLTGGGNADRTTKIRTFNSGEIMLARPTARLAT
jgi:hypothetical protein